MRFHKHIFHEFTRYALIGGIAFIIDISLLYLLKTFVFNHLGHNGILLATGIGFTAGLFFTYTFSWTFVFRQIHEDAKRNKARSFFLFMLIGFAGFFVTEISMHAGVLFFGQEWYLLIKMAIAWVVFMLNYFFRKLVIFKNGGEGEKS